MADLAALRADLPTTAHSDSWRSAADVQILPTWTVPMDLVVGLFLPAV
jgi:hypothetical protein